jgi:hypothetical protein
MIQMKTSMKPSRGASLRRPREVKMIRMVPRLTSMMRAKKIKRGKMTQANQSKPAVEFWRRMSIR